MQIRTAKFYSPVNAKSIIWKCNLVIFSSKVKGPIMINLNRNCYMMSMQYHLITLRTISSFA
jgi:hypothetical protein